MPQRILVYVTLSHLYTWSPQQSSTSVKHSLPLSPHFFFYPFLIHFSSTPFSLVPFPLAFHHFPEFPFVPRNLNGENPLTPPAGRTLLLFFLKYLSSFFFFISLFHTSRNNFFWTTIQASYFQIIIRLLDSWNSKNGFSNYFKFFRPLFLKIILSELLITFLFHPLFCLTFRETNYIISNFRLYQINKYFIWY